MSVDYDLVVVGGGPSGVATALFFLAARPRSRVLLIDRARFPRDKICAGAIGARADRALGEIGVTVEVPAAPVRGLGVATRWGERIERLPIAIGRVVRRREHDAALLSRARERGVEVREGVAFEALSRRGRWVRVTTSRGDVTAHALVGADGVGSRVRRALGLSRGAFYAQAVEVDTPWSGDDRDRDLLWFDVRDDAASGYAWDFPTMVDGTSMVCRGFYRLVHGAPLDREEPDVATLLRRRLERRGISTEGLCFKRFAERGLALYEPYGAERVVLVGEAAGIDPVLGEGIPQAILYGKMAGAYLARAVERERYDFADFRQALRSSRVGIDLRVRSAAVHLFYGRRRDVAEHWVTRSRHLARAGVCYFAGRRVPRRCIAGAGADLVRSALFAPLREPARR